MYWQVKHQTKWPEAKSESKYWKDEGGVDEVEDTDGEDEGSGVPGPGGPVDEQCHYHHQVKTTINTQQSCKQSSRDSYQTPSMEKITAITEANAKNMFNFYRFPS